MQMSKKLTAKEIADDVQQTFDTVTNEYRALLEQRIEEYANQFKRKIKPTIELSVHVQCQKFYIEHQTKAGGEINWDGRYGKSLKSILDKLKTTYSNSNGKEPQEQDMVKSFEFLIIHLPEFYKDKVLHTINSNYDAIVTEIKRNPNGARTKAEKNFDRNASEFGEHLKNLERDRNKSATFTG